MGKLNSKRDQLTITQYEENRAKEGKKKLFSQFPIPALVIFSIPVIILLINLISYIFYIRSISAH